MSEENDYCDNDYPCDNCGQDCDSWEMRFCCTLCHYDGLEDCENCDSRDI